jgi:hypothetical protein
MSSSWSAPLSVVACARLVVMPAPADFSSNGSEEEEDESNDQYNDSYTPENRDLGDESDQQQDDAEDNHRWLLCSVWFCSVLFRFAPSIYPFEGQSKPERHAAVGTQQLGDVYGGNVRRQAMKRTPIVEIAEALIQSAFVSVNRAQQRSWRSESSTLLPPTTKSLGAIQSRLGNRAVGRFSSSPSALHSDGEDQQ